MTSAPGRVLGAQPGPRAAPLPAAPRYRLDQLHLLLAGLALVLLWDLSGLDRNLMQALGSAHGFAWRDHPVTRGWLHDGGRWFSALVLLLLAGGLAWRQAAGLTRAERLRWLATAVACMLLVPALKQFSQTSCPWDLAEFGGTARWLSHWQPGSDGGPGRCFPSGHAVAAFGHIGGWLALRPRHPRLARLWLAGVLVSGSLFGLAQTLRGAHPPSHTLWTAWLCWALSAALLVRRGRQV